MLKASFHPRTFTFGFAARTSRGAMREKKSWFVKLWDDRDPATVGTGECGPLPGLNPEDFAGLEATLNVVKNQLDGGAYTIDDFVRPDDQLPFLREALENVFGAAVVARNSSLAFALETALLDLHHTGKHIIFDNSFYKGVPIPINGLVWMGGLDFMLQQVEIRIRDGFKCVKLKVGGIDFEKEVDIVQYIRRKYFRDAITIRLDANGAFKSDDALLKIKQLAKFDIHSIEQPLRTGAPELAALCAVSPIPIALDEELIGVHEKGKKEQLLDFIKPAYIILKPTLHGGLFGCQEWITLAEQRNIGWWITSALESNIGLNAVSQFTAQYPVLIPQGLGTGSIYTDNIDSPLEVKKGELRYNSGGSWSAAFESLRQPTDS